MGIGWVDEVSGASVEVDCGTEFGAGAVSAGIAETGPDAGRVDEVSQADIPKNRMNANIREVFLMFPFFSPILPQPRRF